MVCLNGFWKILCWFLVLWWINIFTFVFIAIYFVLCTLMIIGVRKRQHNCIIPWISATAMAIPFILMSFLFEILMGVISSDKGGILIPAIIVLILCCTWAYGFCCVVSHYRVRKIILSFPKSIKIIEDNLSFNF